MAVSLKHLVANRLRGLIEEAAATDDTLRLLFDGMRVEVTQPDSLVILISLKPSGRPIRFLTIKVSESF